MDHTRYLPHAAHREDRADGTVLLRSGYALPDTVDTSGDWLRHWAKARPDTVFLAERSGPGWRAVSYAEAWPMVQSVAHGLLDLGLACGDRILILSGNSVNHGLLSLAAHYVGLITVPIAEQYARVPGALGQVRYILDLVDPALIYAEDAALFAEALNMPEMAGRQVVVTSGAHGAAITFDTLLRGGTAGVEDAAAQVTPDTVVKILMTSGSTSNPKGVMTTHHMMCINQAQNTQAMPFLTRRPPRLVDWLPWNHVFGGSNNFNQVLANGGSLYIDAGKPAKALIGQTIENTLLQSATIAYNVPVGFALLRDAMRTDKTLRQRFFEDLDMVFYAGASLPADVRRDLTEMAADICETPPLITSCWGMTETAPACIFQHEPDGASAVVGVPLPGVTVKLVPEDGHRFDVRVKGPNITPGYYNAPDRTAAAFDDEGFFITGDAMSWADPADVNKGLRFESRISEDFKLQTGTWVRAAQLRLDLLVALAPLVADIVITGEDRTELGLLLLLAPDTVTATDDLTEDRGAGISATLHARFARTLSALARSATGSSNRITRALILTEPASIADGEITAKGNLNFRKLLTRRAGLVARLYDDTDGAVIHIDPAVRQ